MCSQRVKLGAHREFCCHLVAGYDLTQGEARHGNGSAAGGEVGSRFPFGNQSVPLMGGASQLNAIAHTIVN
jgi:hypothetical protein